MPKVSVVIPTYNYGRFLVDCIQSVLDQTFEDFELIIVDDGSTDNTKEVVSSFADPRIRYLYQDNHGGAVAMNRGVLESCGEYIAFLDADDIWLPQKLELQVKMLDSDMEMGIVCTDAYLFDSETGTVTRQYWHNDDYLDVRNAPRDALTRLLYAGCFIKGSTPVVRRSVFDYLGLFDESLRPLQDWEMYVRILLHYNVGTIDIPLARCRRHGVNLTSDANMEGQYRALILGQSKVLRSYHLSKANLRVLRRRLALSHHGYGSYLTLDNRVALGREQFVAAIRVNPWFIKPYIYLTVSFLGRRTVVTLLSWKKRLQTLLCLALALKQYEVIL